MNTQQVAMRFDRRSIANESRENEAEVSIIAEHSKTLCSMC